MAVQLLTTPGYVAYGSSSASTYSLTLPYGGPPISGPDVLGLMYVGNDGHSGSNSYSSQTTSCQWGGVMMTSLGKMYNSGDTFAWSEIFYLNNPPTGVQSIVYASSGTKSSLSMSFNAVTYSGVDESYIPALRSVGSGSVPWAGTTVASNVGDRIFALYGVNAGTVTLALNGSIDTSIDFGSGRVGVEIADLAGGGAVPVTLAYGDGSDLYWFGALDIPAPRRGTQTLTTVSVQRASLF